MDKRSSASSPALGNIALFHVTHSGGWVVLSHCGFMFPADYWHWKTFYMFIGHFDFCLLWHVYSSPLLIFFLLILGIIYIFGVIYPRHPKYTCVYLSHSVSCLSTFSVIFWWIFISFWVLPFHFQCCFLMDTILNFTEVQYVLFFFFNLYGQCFLCPVEKSASSVYEDFLSSGSITVLPFIFKSEIV